MGKYVWVAIQAVVPLTTLMRGLLKGNLGMDYQFQSNFGTDASVCYRNSSRCFPSGSERRGNTRAFNLFVVFLGGQEGETLSLTTFGLP